MPVRVTLDVFSGRPNPTIELGRSTGAELLELMVTQRKAAHAQPEDQRPALGYRGVIIEHGQDDQVKLPDRFRVFRDRLIGGDACYLLPDTAIETILLREFRALRPDLLSTGLIDSIDSGRREMSERLSPIKTPAPATKGACACAPLYEPQWWNDGAEGGAIQFHNNCYNYACDYRSDTFAQPGRAAGAMYAHLECASVAPAALKDRLENYPRRQIQCPEEGHLVALVVWPQFDFHWYRLGRDGLWSHKPGGMPVTNVDNSGHVIRDPRLADRGDYTKFCAFMIVRHGHVKIQ